MARRTLFQRLLAFVTIFAILCLFAGAFAQGNRDAAFERVKEVQERHTEKLMARPGVVGTAIGLADDDNPAMFVLLEHGAVAGIPAQLDGVKVKKRVTGKIYARADTVRHDRPVPIGVSTGHPAITAGTIGCRVTDGTSVYALSNNHVFANENLASIGDPVIQPGTSDGGSSPADDIGTLYDFEPIRRNGNEIDAAIALSSGANLRYSTPAGGYGTPSSTTVTATVGLAVKKYGRTTMLTHGHVTYVNATVRVIYSSGIKRFIGQIIIEPGTFSSGGDSGSLIVTENGENPVGLLFAGSSSITIANPIDAVLSRFGVTVDDGSPQPTAPPVADFSGNPTSGTAPLTVNFTDLSTGSPTSWSWSFGDTGTSTAQNPSHTYTAAGTYTVSLTATNGDGSDLETKSGYITVSNPGAGPTTASVTSIAYDTGGGKNQNRHLLITLLVQDDQPNPVANALVDIDVYLDAGLYSSQSGTTGADGTVTFKLANAPSGHYTTTVIDVVAAGLAWDGEQPSDSGFTK